MTRRASTALSPVVVRLLGAALIAGALAGTAYLLADVVGRDKAVATLLVLVVVGTSSGVLSALAADRLRDRFGNRGPRWQMLAVLCGVACPIGLGGILLWARVIGLT